MFRCHDCSAFLTDLTVEVNILIDEHHSARLADFGLLTTVSNNNSVIIRPQCGAIGWMSPKLMRESERGHPTGQLDCYAFGMVVYEIIAEKLPFNQDTESGGARGDGLCML